MQSNVYTQDDLKQILQKVIGQKQSLPSPRPERTEQEQQDSVPNYPDICPIVSPDMQSQSTDFAQHPVNQVESPPETAIEALKTITEEKIDEPSTTSQKHGRPIVHEEVIPQPDLTQVIAIEKLNQEKELLAQELEKAKEALTKFAKKKSSQKEIEQYKETISTLTVALEKVRSEPREHPEVDTLRIENDKAKAAIRELSNALVDTKELLKKRDEELIRKDLQGQDSQEHKLRILRLIADKKELEDKITSLSCEKATLAARLQSLQQKSQLGDETQTALTAQLTELTSALEETTEILEKTQNTLQEKQALASSHEFQNQKLMQELQDLQASHEELKARAIFADEHTQDYKARLESAEIQHSQELAVCQACLVEQSRALEEEQKKHRLLAEEHIFVKKRLEEQENHLRLLEQHLSRRVKECALLSKQLEEQMDRVSVLHTQLAATEQKYAAQDEAFSQLQQDENSLRKEFDTQIKHYQQERQDLLQLLETKEQELYTLRQMQNQYSELEQLFKKSTEIFAVKAPEAPPVALLAPKSQSDFFNQVQSQKPAKSSFFD